MIGAPTSIRDGFTAFKLIPYRIALHAHPGGEVVCTSADCFARLRDSSSRSMPMPKIFEPWQAVQLGNALAPMPPVLRGADPARAHPGLDRVQVKALQCPLATGESLYGRFEFLSLLSAGGADVIGGLLEMRRIAALAEAHFVTVAPHNPMGPLATAVSVHFCAAQSNFKILEYRLPERAPYVEDPYLPKDGRLELRHDGPGWEVEIDEEVLRRDEYVHWERKLPLRPDGSTDV